MELTDQHTTRHGTNEASAKDAGEEHGPLRAEIAQMPVEHDLSAHKYCKPAEESENKPCDDRAPGHLLPGLLPRRVFRYHWSRRNLANGQSRADRGADRRTRKRTSKKYEGQQVDRRIEPADGHFRT